MTNTNEQNFELQLREYQQRIANILESFTDGFFELAMDWTVTYFNKEAERMLMISRSEIIGKNLWEVFAEAIPLKFYTEYHKAIAQNISVRFEEYFPPKDLWVEVAAFPSGQGLSVYFKDITARKRATEQLQQEKKKYSELFNFSPVPQWVFDLETTRFLDVNEAAVIHYGYSREEFLKMDIKQIRPKEDVAPLEHILQNKIKSGIVNKSHVRHQKKNGEIIYVLVEGNSLDFEGKQARLVMAIDRTWEIIAENAMKDSIEKFNIVSKATSDAIWDRDMLSGKMIWNQGIKGIFGYEETTYDVQWWQDRVHPEDLPHVLENMKLLMEKREQRLQVNYRFLNANGIYRFVLDRAFIIFNENNIPIRLIGSMQDITDYVNQMSEIEEQNKRLKHISWIQSHKVRGPLARIIGLSALLNEDALSNDEKNEFARDIKNAANELDLVIEEIVKKTELKGDLKLTFPVFNIKALRLQHGWTQDDVAGQLQVSTSVYSEWEHSKTEINYRHLEQLARLFGVSVMELISEKYE